MDDSEINREILRYPLCSRGYTVVEAGDGLEALELFDILPPPDLVLLDLAMPRMDGRGVLQGLRDRNQRSVPVVILTASSPAENLDLIALDEVRDVVPKPYSVSKLLEVILPIAEGQ